MAYRNIPRPGNPRSLTTTEDWVGWASQEHLLPSVAPHLDNCCALCHGAVGYTFEGEPFTYCQHCISYRRWLDTHLPIVYSLDNGLESLLHRYKDFGRQYRWMALPLASVLFEFLDKHLECIEERYGNIDLATTVPSANATRDFDHVREIIDRIAEWPLTWVPDLLAKIREGRPARGTTDSSFYRIEGEASVEYQSILVFDDTWTSGSSLASVARRLKEDGAKHVVGVTLGRQLHGGWGTADDLVEKVASRAFDNTVCVICG